MITQTPPAIFSHLLRLKTLDLSNNLLTSVPEMLCSDEGTLDLIQLSANVIFDILETDFKHCSRVTYLFGHRLVLLLL
jgi:Leucine-rich repeat (LRR) protein